MKHTLLTLALALLSLTAWADNQPSLQPGTPAPAFAAADTLGVSHSLADFAGKYVLVDFWASWCGDCRREFPALKALYADLAPRGVEFVSVAFDDNADNWKACLRKQQFGWLQVSNLQPWKQNDIATAYDLHWVPTLFVVDPAGVVVAADITVEGLRAKLDSVGLGATQAPCCKSEKACKHEGEACKDKKEACKEKHEGCKDKKDACKHEGEACKDKHEGCKDKQDAPCCKDKAKK